MHKSARQKIYVLSSSNFKPHTYPNYSGATLPVHHLVRIDIWPHILAIIVSGQSQRVNPDFGPHLSGLEHSLTAKISKICPDWETSFGCIFRGPVGVWRELSYSIDGDKASFGPLPDIEAADQEHGILVGNDLDLPAATGSNNGKWVGRL